MKAAAAFVIVGMAVGCTSAAYAAQSLHRPASAPRKATPASSNRVVNRPPTVVLSTSASSVPAIGGSFKLSYSASGASTCTISSTPAFWSGANPATVSCNGVYRGNVPAAAMAQQWTFTLTATTRTGQTATKSQTLTKLPPPVSQSSNWSGYVVPSSTMVTQASGSWLVPTLNCVDTPNAGESTWVGIGGYGLPTGRTSGVLLQTGITDQCVNGAQQDSGWFEEVPSTPNESKAFRSFPVSPGDAMTASVYQASGGAWETRIDDLTTGLSGIMVTGKGWGVAADASGTQTFSEQGTTSGLTYAGGTTAEWIVEDFAVGSTTSIVPLANYGTVTFSNLQTSLASWSLTTGVGLAITQGGVTLSTPSAPSITGFSVSYTGP
ncbi:MAG TPA: G1 family glutamic endopeptidase [Gaiellaceae bacterium]|nr:G1 family glutamic endopeptidase [Gaiellaceae bacterium]